jgi:PAS domain S-box-containing protein
MSLQFVLEEDSGSSERYRPRTTSAGDCHVLRKNRRVLVIDADFTEFVSIQAFLRNCQQVDYQVTHATSCSEGLARLAQDRFRVVLMKLEQSSPEELDDLRQVVSRARSAPVIVLSDDLDLSLAAAVNAMGASDCLALSDLDQQLLWRSIEQGRVRHKLQHRLNRSLELLQASEDNLFRVLSACSEGMLVVDPEGIVLFSNAAAQRLFGLSGADLQRESLTLPLVANQVSAIWIGRRDRTRIPVEAHVIDLLWENQPAFLVMLRDLTPQRTAELSAAQMDAITACSNDAIINVGLDGRVQSWNMAAEKLYGYSASEMVGQPLARLFAPGNEDSFHPLSFLLKGKVHTSFEAVQVRKDGTPVNVEVTARAVRSAGEVVGLTSVSRDISLRKDAESERLKRFAAEQEIELACTIQTRLFSADRPRLRGFDVAGAVVPAGQGSGDYFDLISLPDDELGVVVADVSGHGLGPAMMMVQTRAYLRALMPREPDLGEVLGCCNQLHSDAKSGHFLTMFVGRIASRSRSFTFASAGHVAYWLKNDGSVEKLQAPGTVMGVWRDDVDFTSNEIVLQPGDLLLLPTDGIQESRSPKNELFGVQRMLDLVRAHRDQTATNIVKAICHGVSEWLGDRPQDDDITAVIVKVLENGVSKDSSRGYSRSVEGYSRSV